MLKRYVIGGVIAATGIGAAFTALAADMPALFPSSGYEDAEPAPRVEFGTGWYLRGDISGSDEIEPAVLGTLDNSRDRRDWGYAVGAGAGYKFNSYFRADLTGDYMSTQKSSATDPLSAELYKTNVRRWDGMVNGYFDIGNWGGLTPYIGGGVGFASLKTDGSVPLNGVYTKLSGEDRYNFAWAAMAGVSYSVSPHMMLDVGYRYIDLGNYKNPITGDKTDVNAHQVRVGLRYMID